MAEENTPDISGLEEVVRVDWIEYEPGWGMDPDGCSLHLTKEDFWTYYRRYWEGMPEEEPPEGYEAPMCTPHPAYVSKALYREIQTSECGIRLAELIEDAAIEDGHLVIVYRQTT